MSLRERAVLTCGVQLFDAFLTYNMKTKYIQHNCSSDADGSSAAHEIPAFMETEDSLWCFQQPATCPYIEPGQCSSAQDPILVIYILKLKSHLRLGLTSGCFPLGFPTKSLYGSYCSHKCHLPCPSQPSYFITLSICWVVQATNVLIMQLSPVFCLSSLLDPSALVSTISLCDS
jgi:hypothetical protein